MSPREVMSMTPAQIAQLLSQPTLSIPEAGAVIGYSRNVAYDAVKRGDIPVISLGGRKRRVPTSFLKDKLRLAGAAA